MEKYKYVLDNYNQVLNKAKEAMANCNRDDDLTLIAVSKNFEAEKIEVLVKAGVVDFGESRVQEFLPKYEQFKEFDINWHFIGHLQKNKVKYIVDKVKYIHSVDSLELAETINKECAKKNIKMKIFLQVNVGKDTNKYGFSYDEAMETYFALQNMANVEFVGFMTILPILDTANAVDNFYGLMNKLVLDNSSVFIDNKNVAHLSMGMSDDFDIGIKHNSNFIRVGSAIFGDRYN